MAPRGKPNLDAFLAGGSAEGPTSSSAAAPAAVTSIAPAAPRKAPAAPAAPGLTIADKPRTYAVSIRADEAAVKMIELYARVHDVRPHALFRQAVRNFALEVAEDPGWQSKLPAEWKAAVEQHRDALKRLAED
jgi:hypothetical protein